MAASCLDFRAWRVLSSPGRECGIPGFPDIACSSLDQFLAQEVCLPGLTTDLEGADNLADRDASPEQSTAMVE